MFPKPESRMAHNETGSYEPGLRPFEDSWNQLDISTRGMVRTIYKFFYCKFSCIALGNAKLT